MGGKKGGKARAEKLTAKKRSEIARKAAKARITVIPGAEVTVVRTAESRTAYTAAGVVASLVEGAHILVRTGSASGIEGAVRCTAVAIDEVAIVTLLASLNESVPADGLC